MNKSLIKRLGAIITLLVVLIAGTGLFISYPIVQQAQAGGGPSVDESLHGFTIDSELPTISCNVSLAQVPTENRFTRSGFIFDTFRWSKTQQSGSNVTYQLQTLMSSNPDVWENVLYSTITGKYDIEGNRTFDQEHGIDIGSNVTRTVAIPNCKPPIKKIVGIVEDSHEKRVRQTPISVTCNGQTVQTATGNVGNFQATFNNTCPEGSTVTITIKLGIPYLPGTTETGSGTLNNGDSTGIIKLGLPVSPPQGPTETNIESLAVKWAESMVDNKAGKSGGKYWYDCLAFVVDAYTKGASYKIRKDFSVAIDNNTFPDQVWDHFKNGTIDINPNDTPPPGALVFWYSTGGIPGETDYMQDSHVALSIGNGDLVTTNTDQPTVTNYNGIHYEKISQFAANSWNIYKGWWLPDQ